MKILVTGCSGMLGSAVMPHLAELGHEARGVDLRHKDASSRLDISDWNALRSLPWGGFDLVMHLAAATDVDACEKDPDFAFRQNALATQFIARLCAEHDRPLVYISTASVFAGNPKKGHYTEFDEPAPENEYAKSKLAGEQAVREAVRKHFIVRAAWMMGGDAEEKKFVGKIVAQLLEGRRKLMAVSDKRGTLTFTKDLARNLMALVESGHYGTYHMANPGEMTRHDIARRIVSFLKIDAEVEAVPSSKFPLPAPRPDSECLRNYKLELLGLQRMPPGEESLDKYLSRLVTVLKK